MGNYFENKLTYEQISFCHTNMVKVKEREIHAYNEILFYMDRGTPFLTESFSRQIERNTLVFIPKEKYHYFDNGKADTFERLKISFPDIPEFEDLHNIRIIDKPDESIQFVLNKICTALKNEERYIALGAFLILLSEIAKMNTDISVTNGNNSQLVSECIELINNNLKNGISIEYISKKLNVSESTITHSFKKEMGISVHRYIQQKRMILAKKLIEAGEKPTKIYFDCGYTEYSAFYKAYCKMFGSSPSEGYGKNSRLTK